MTVKIQSLRRFVWSSSDDTAGSRAQPIPSQLYQTSNDYYYTTITRYTTLQTKMFHVEHKTVNWKTSCPCRPSSYDLGTVNVLLDQIRILRGRLQIFGTMHKKMQISLKWLKYRLKILKSSFIYYFYIVFVVPKLKKLKKSPYDQNNRNWMSHWHHAKYHIFCNFHWKFGTQPLKHFISIST